MTKPVVLVTGATGNVGQATLAHLQQYREKLDVRAGVRDPAASKDKLGKFDVPLVQVHPDDGNHDALVAAFKGVDALFIVTPGAENRAELSVAQIRAAKDAGVKFVMAVSVSAAGLEGKYGQVLFARQIRPIEEALASSGLSYAVLRLPLFLDNYYMFAQGVKEHGKIYTPVKADAPHQSVAVADVGRTSAAILADPAQHHNKTYTLTTSKQFRLQEFVDALSKHTGKDIELVNVPHEAAVEAMGKMGIPEWQAKGIRELNEGLNDGAFKDVTDDVERITGKAARTIDEWVAENAAGFKA